MSEQSTTNDEQPPDLDGPPDPQPPTMPEPDTAAPEAQRGTASTPQRRSLFPAGGKPPVGASPLLEFILEVVNNEGWRNQIEQAAWSLNDGHQEHLLNKAAALFSGIQQAHLARAEVLYVEHRKLLSDMGAAVADLNAIIAEHDSAGEQEGAAAAEGEQPGTSVKPGTLAASLRPIVAAEVDRAVAAASKVNVRNLKILCGLAFLLGIIFTALFVHFF